MIILGLGSNIGDRLAHLRQALKHLRVINGLKIIRVSPVYESEALLPDDPGESWNQPYLNCAISCTSSLNPENLLTKIKAIEAKMGRVVYKHWSPRIIDIDILAWNEEVIQTEKLHIPHEGLLERPFAFWPMADVDPEWKYCAPNKNETGQPAHALVKKWGSRFSGDAPLKTRQIAHRIDTPEMVGILNVTPDSFSDGGKFFSVEKALLQAKEMFKAGADIIDIGAESTRPRDSVTLTTKEELIRLRPILEAVRDAWPSNSFRPKISIDTRNAATAATMLQYNIDFINDVSGFADEAMYDVAFHCNAKLVFMHNLGFPPTAENILPESECCVKIVHRWAEEKIYKFCSRGIAQDRLIFDVGIGFGKSAAQSWELLRNIDSFSDLHVPLLVGHSRKSFLSLITDKPFAERDIETAAISVNLARKNVSYLRVHNVDLNMRMLRVLCETCKINI